MNCIDEQSFFSKRMLWWTIGLTVFVELICVVLRFGFDKDSTSATASTIGVLTFGIRIHHGYIGAVMIPASLIFFDRAKPIAKWVFVVGVALFASDMIHHFLVLWPITGSPDFDLVYPSS